MPKNRPNRHERNKAKAAEASQQHQEDVEMQMNIDNAAEQELAIQPANQLTSTLFLDFGGSTDDGQHKENTGSWDATDQAFNAIEATSAGEYASKTAGSIGTVNFQLQRHEHEIMVNEHMGNENRIAIDQMREDIKTERGNVRACQKFVADFEKDLKTLQNNVETMQEEFKLFRRATEVHSEKVQKQFEVMNHENKIQSLVLQSIAKSVTGKDDEEMEQASFPKSTRSQNWINQLRLEAVQL
ncbi:hypothetical protein SLS64_006801 [Diaporthe eres]